MTDRGTFIPSLSLTRLIGVSEVRAKVVHQVKVTSLLHAAHGLTESLLGDLVQLFPAQTQVVAVIGAQHLLEDVLVIWRVPVSLGTVDEPLDLSGGDIIRLRKMKKTGVK